jgi:DNA polymerase
MFSKPEEVERALSVIRSRVLELVEYEYHPHDALEIVASCLRSMIIAAPGHRLISADFSAIQAVATSCMANEQWRIDVFRTHGKIYETMASMLTGKPLEFYLEYKEREKKHHPDRQDFGKIPVLSADFGAWIGGWKRFGADKLGDDKYIKSLILKTRDRIPNVVNFWGGQTINKFRDEQEHLFGLEGAAVSAIREPGQCFNSRPGSRLGVLYQVYEDVLYCRPPSGGFIRYHSPRLTPSSRNYASPWEYEMSYEGWNSNQTKGPIGWIRMKLYGGVQCQNVISHMCREIQADALLALEAAGYPVVMHTHDENVTEVPYGVGSREHYMHVMRSSLPTWAICEDGQPWPIKIPDAWEAQRYGKWED